MQKWVFTNREMEQWVGQYGYGERNERGTILAQFVTSENLTISSTCFKKRKSRKWTWRSPNGLVKT